MKTGKVFDILWNYYNRVKCDMERGYGEVAEWSIAAVLKTVDREERSQGSNPCLSANIKTTYTDNLYLGITD